MGFRSSVPRPQWAPVGRSASSRAARGPSQRQLRVGEMLRHALAEILSRGLVRDEALEGVLITVSQVEVSPDLRNATVFIVASGGAGTKGALEGLTRSRRFIRGELGRRVRIKFTPSLSFAADESFEQAARVEAILRSDRVTKDLDDADPGQDAAEDGAEDGNEDGATDQPERGGEA